MSSKMRKMMAVVLGATLTAGMLAGCGGSKDGGAAAASSGAKETQAVKSGSAPAATATEGEPMTIKISTVLTEDSISGKALQKFADDLSAKTGGRISTEVYYNGVLADYESSFEMLQSDDIQMMTLNPVAYETQVTELATLDEYYMFDDLEHAHRFIEGEGGQFLHDAWNSVNLQGMAVYGLGFRELSNNKKEVKTVADMKSMTLRGYSTIQIDAWNAVGASPTSVDWSELFVSMQQGLLDGQESALSTINDFKFYEVQKYITMTDHVYTMDWVVGNKAWLDEMDEADRTVIMETMQESYEWQKEAYIADLDKLRDKFETEFGIKVTDLDDSVKAEMKEKMGQVTVDAIKKVSGEEVYNKVHEYVEAARA